jgi:hypothetical protein
LNSISSSISFSVDGTGDGEARKLHVSASDGIGANPCEFWIKDDKGKKRIEESPYLDSTSETSPDLCIAEFCA